MKTPHYDALLEPLILSIQIVGTLMIGAALLAALLALARGRGIARARLLVIEGVLYGLSFELAGTLLKTLVLHTWQEIGIFAAIFAIRTVVKLALNWEARHLNGGLSTASLRYSNGRWD